MRRLVKQWGLLVLIAAVGLSAARADSVSSPAGSLEQLKAEAFKAIRSGDFDRGSTLLSRAAEQSGDPQVQRMAQWTRQFDQQCRVFADQRRGQFDQAVALVRLFMDHKMDAYAIDEAKQAYVLADDKEAFRAQPWVRDLMDLSARAAQQSEAAEQWLNALRLFGDLCALEPTNAHWKNEFDVCTRRVTLLMVYAPAQLKKLQDAELPQRQAADALLKSATRPSAATPASAPDRPDEPAGDYSPLDWREITKGIQYDMLWNSLLLTQQQYYRDVTFQALLEGGLNGLRMLATTHGLEATFGGLADADRRQRFLAGIDACMADAKAAGDDTAEEVLTQSLSKLRDLNQKTVQLPEEVFVSEFADGAFADLDPYSKVIWPSELEDTDRLTSGTFGGVGLEIQNDEAGNLKVVSPLEGTPAYRSGIKAGDVIWQIDGKSAKGMAVDRAVKLIVGVPGTSVTLTIRSLDGTMRDHVVCRELIKEATVQGYARKPGGGWNYFVDPQQKIAYVRLTKFSKSTSDDLDAVLAQIKAEGARAIILDLRHNLGGVFPAATGVVNKFVGNGVIVRTQADRLTGNPPTVVAARPSDVETDLPMVVLVNQWSASASEIVSGALKDDNRALIVGQRTFGKGSVQMLFQLDGNKAYLKLTTAHYYLPGGRCIHREENSTTWGVEPDIAVEMTPQQMLTAMDARQDLDVLRDADPQTRPTTATTAAADKVDLLKADSQLAAGVLVLRLELAGAQLL